MMLQSGHQTGEAGVNLLKNSITAELDLLNLEYSDPKIANRTFSQHKILFYLEYSNDRSRCRSKTEKRCTLSLKG